MVTRSLITFLPDAHNSDREDPLSYRPTRTHLQYYEYHCLTKKMAHYSCALAFCIPLESGFVAAKFTVQYSAPFHLLFLRGAFSCLVLLLLTLGFRARFPSGR